MIFVPTAYVLLNCELGSEGLVLEQLKNIDFVKEAYGVFGYYDIIAKLESDDVTNLRIVISNKIRRIDRVNNTISLLGIDGQN